MNTSKDMQEKAKNEAVETILSWQKLGIKVEQLSFILTLEGTLYHPSEDCIGVPEKHEASLKVTIKELESFFTEDLICPTCKNLITFTSPLAAGREFNFQDVDYLMNWLKATQKLKFKKKSFNVIAEKLELRIDVKRIIHHFNHRYLTPGGYLLPGGAEIVRSLEKRAETFDQELEEFTNSPEGLAVIIKHSSREALHGDPLFFPLPAKSQNGKNGPRLLKESKEFNKVISKSIKRLTKAPIYSLCRDTNQNLRFIDSPANENLERAALNQLILKRWLNGSNQVAAVPYMVFLYLKRELGPSDFEAIHLDEEPDTRLLECVEAFLSADGQGFSLLEAYNAAVAID